MNGKIKAYAMNPISVLLRRRFFRVVALLLFLVTASSLLAADARDIELMGGAGNEHPCVNSEYLRQKIPMEKLVDRSFFTREYNGITALLFDIKEKDEAGNGKADLWVDSSAFVFGKKYFAVIFVTAPRSAKPLEGTPEVPVPNQVEHWKIGGITHEVRIFGNDKGLYLVLREALDDGYRKN